MDTFTLDKLNINERGRVAALLARGAMRQRMIALGIVEGTEIECIGRSPLGDPSAYWVRGAVIAIRKKDARSILVFRKEACDGAY